MSSRYVFVSCLFVNKICSGKRVQMNLYECFEKNNVELKIIDQILWEILDKIRKCLYLFFFTLLYVTVHYRHITHMYFTVIH